ncbi:hypothetical protein Bca52824_006835 [Brassica carinata]|uniref:Uncharacterized protein n=1 Tax=Brassica carinata TaxID=52824 RepID=A0A8X7W6S5_BRACI|nr:hypothetical protein Bca52824_006835 [Brassica carinata]
MPYWLDQFMRDNIGVGPKMIIEKSLTATDLNTNNGRLSMPSSQIVDKDFMTKEEKRSLSFAGRLGRNYRWNQVVEDVELQEKDNIRLWSFHSDGKLFFALILLPPSTVTPGRETVILEKT